MRGTMVLSLDLELSWGWFDLHPMPTLNAQSLEERKQIKRLLALLDRYEIPATWAIVGHLMLDDCTRDREGKAHADIVPRATYSWFPHDWYCADPCTKASLAPGWYAPDILEWIRGARVRHEIGSHSFAHVCYGDPECSSSVAQADLKAALEAAARKGITLRSFVFPRNQVGHLGILKRSGLKAYRGADPPILLSVNGALLRTFTFLDQLLAFRPKPVQAEETQPELWNIPGNHLYMARHELRKIIPIASRVLKGRRGINGAVKTGGLYHLWFHPCNLNIDPEPMFSGLEKIFAYASRMRERGLLNILTMGEYAQRLEGEKKPALQIRDL